MLKLCHVIACFYFCSLIGVIRALFISGVYDTSVLFCSSNRECWYGCLFFLCIKVRNSKQESPGGIILVRTHSRLVVSSSNDWIPNTQVNIGCPKI